MRTSKKGVTLVELIICCAIIVILAGACTSVLLTGFKVYSSSSSAANMQLEADVLQKNVYSKLTRAKGITLVSDDVAEVTTEGNAIYFDENDTFTIRHDGEITTISDIETFTYSLSKAGDNTSEDARVVFNYTATFDNGNSFSGGMVLSNVSYASLSTLNPSLPAEWSWSDISLQDDAKNTSLHFLNALPETEESSSI